jgi:ribosomal protein S18 acetylase RimI-like enzyme
MGQNTRGGVAMPLRPLRLPGDLTVLGEVIPRAFQYPENPEWSLRRDEMEDIVRMIRSLRWLWPLVRILQIVSATLRDLFRGFVWEENGRLAGAVMTQRHGTTALWEVGLVGVLPEYRRRGIARRLLVRSLEDLRDRGAEKASLGVIDQNVPAYSLYASLGFEHYGGVVEFEIALTEAPKIPVLPAGYAVEAVKRSRSWRVRYDLDKRINPPELTEYEPVILGRYRPPLVLRPVLPLMRLLQRRERKLIRIRRTRDGQVVALARYDVPKREGGVNSIRVVLDPECPELADYLVAYHLERAIARGPERRIDFFVPDWMSHVIEAAERHGFTKRVHYHSLGLSF